MASSCNELLARGSHSVGTLAGWWGCQDNDASTTVIDDSGNGKTGTLEGGDNTSDKAVTGPNSYLTSAFDLNGSDDWVDIPGLTQEFTEWTIFSRVNSSLGGSLRSWISHDNNGSGNAGNLYLANESNGIRARFGSKSHSATSLGLSSAWHDISVHYANDPETRIRVDGSDVYTETSTSENITNWTAGWALGALVTSGSDAYNWTYPFCDVSIFTESLTGAESDELADGLEPVNSVAPVASGTESEGETLSCTSGTWAIDSPFGGSNGTLTYAYQWTRSDDGTGTNEADISGATSTTYVVTATDVGKYLRCRVRSSNDGGADPDADTNSNFTGAISGSGGGSTVPVFTQLYQQMRTR